MGLRPLLTEEHAICTSEIHTQRSLGRQPASAEESTLPWGGWRWAKGAALALLAWSRFMWRAVSPSGPTQCSQSSKHSHEGSLLPPMTLSLIAAVCYLGLQLWHGLCVREKIGFFLNFMEIYLGPQDFKLAFFVSRFTGGCYVCAQSYRAALDETCTSSCQ